MAFFLFSENEILLKLFQQLCKMVNINSDYSENLFLGDFLMSQTSATSQSTWR